MANPKSPGSMDYWVSDQIWMPVAQPKTGDTGDLDTWVSDEIWLVVLSGAEGDCAVETVTNTIARTETVAVVAVEG